MSEELESESLSEEELLFLYKHRHVNPLEVFFERYIFLIQKTIRSYFATSYDRDDFLQEARIVLHKVLDNFDSKHGVTLGQYFRKALQNRYNTIIRRDNALKRKGDKTATSFDKMQETDFFDHKYFQTEHGTHPIEMIILEEKLTGYSRSFSKTERKVFEVYMTSQTLEECLEKAEMDEKSFRNALARCKYKIKKRIS